MRVDQICRVKLVAAVVALVAARSLGPTQWARALDVTVRQGASRRGRDCASRGFHQHVAVVSDNLKHGAHNVVVITGGGARKQVVGQAQCLQVFDNQAVIAVGKFAGGDVFLVSRHQDRCAVLVRSRHHQDVVPRHSHIAGEHVRGNTETSNMTNVARPVSVGPRDGRQNTTHTLSLD